MSEIRADRIRRIIEAGVEAKKNDPSSDLTPLSYRKVEEYIIHLENKIINLGGELPKVVY